MDRVLANLRNRTIRARNKKAGDQNSGATKHEPSFHYLPLELLEKIFQHLNPYDILLCRRVCSFLRQKVDQLHTRNSILILNDGIYRRRPSQSIYFEFYKLTVQKLVIWKIPASFFLQNFYYVTELECSDCINTKNFQKLLESTPNLQIFRMNSIALGGSKNLQPGSSSKDHLNLEVLRTPEKDNEENWTRPLSITEIHLTLDYVPGFHKGFSCHQLIANLLGIYNWNTPSLQTISFTVEPSSLMEQFYFSLDTFLSAIPYASYKSLASLTINSPKLQPSQSTASLPNPDLLKIQLKHLSLQISNSSRVSLSSAFTKFLFAQKNLTTLVIDMKDPTCQELVSNLKKQNDGLQQWVKTMGKLSI